MRLTQTGVRNIRRGLIRSWQDGTHRQRQLARAATIDADTLRSRALADRKGSLVLRGVVSGGAAGTYGLELRWSTAGRSDQLDVFVDSLLVATCRPSLVFEHLVKLSAP